MRTAIKTAIKFLNEQRIHSSNIIPPPRTLIKNKEFSHKGIFFFTMDDIWEKTNIYNLKKIKNLLDKYQIKGTFFITPYYDYHELSKKKAGEIENLLKTQEIAMHGIRHKRDLIESNTKERIYELKHGKKLLEKRFNKKIQGYRSPNFLRNRNLLKDLASTGFTYNSDQFLLRPYPFIKNKLVVIPCHDKCDPFSMNLNKKEIIKMINRKLNYYASNDKPYVFLMHPEDINKKNLSVLSKIFQKVKSKGFVTNSSLSDFSKKLWRKH